MKRPQQCCSTKAQKPRFGREKRMKAGATRQCYRLLMFAGVGFGLRGAAASLRLTRQ
jgi:hypothetical protein